MKKTGLVLIGMITILMFLKIDAAIAGRQDIMFVIDNSGSMRQNDPDIMTKSFVSAFIKQLDMADRVGIVIFDESARLAVPLTLLNTPASREKLFKSLDNISYQGQRTNTPDAIERAVYELRTDGRKESRRSIVFLTDGIIDTGNAQDDSIMTKWLIEDLTAECKDLKISIFGVAFTEDADFHLIQSLAVRTQGAYFRSLEADDIQDAFKDIREILTAKTDSKPKTVVKQAPPVKPVTSTKPAPPAKQVNPTPPVVPVKPVNMPKHASSKNGNIATVKINETNSDSLLSTILRNFFRLTFALVIMSAMGFAYYRFSNQKKASPVKLIAQKPRNEDVLPIINPQAQLLGIYDTDADNTIPAPLYILDKPKVTIGRASQNEIVIPQTTVSNFHAIIEYVNGHFQLEDNKSTNGTFLGNKRLLPNQPVRLKHGDIVKFATFDFRFLHNESALSHNETIMMTERVNITNARKNA